MNLGSLIRRAEIRQAPQTRRRQHANVVWQPVVRANVDQEPARGVYIGQDGRIGRRRQDEAGRSEPIDERLPSNRKVQAQYLPFPAPGGAGRRLGQAQLIPQTRPSPRSSDLVVPSAIGRGDQQAALADEIRDGCDARLR